MGEDWEDFLSAIAERETKAKEGTRSLCQRCAQFRVNPPKKVCWKCRERERLTVRRRLKKADAGLCLAHRCMNAAMPGFSHCINHRGRRIVSDRDASHTLLELQEARAEIDRLRRLIRDQTGVMVQGQTFWPDWVMAELGAEATAPGRPIGELPGEGGE